MKIRYLFLASLITIFCLKSVSAGRNAIALSASGLDAKNVKAWRRDDVEALLKDAAELYKQKKYDEALAKCVRASELGPKDFRPHYYAGVIYAAQSNFKAASEKFARAIQLKPDEKEIYLNKAKVDLMRGAKDDAVAACRKALELDPGFAAAYLTIGDALRDDEKRRDEAEAAYEAAVKADPKVPGILEDLGQFYLYSKKDKAGAEDMFRKAMKLDPARMAGRFHLGRMLVEQGRLREAREIWEGRGNDKDDTFPNFITLLERAERLKAATDQLARKPDDPEALLQMGHAVMDGDSWVVDGRQEKAIGYFRKALKIKPDYAAAQFAIGKAYVQIADTYESKNKNVDEELAKLRKMDAKLAKELEEYRRTYSGGLLAAPINTNK